MVTRHGDGDTDLLKMFFFRMVLLWGSLLEIFLPLFVWVAEGTVIQKIELGET